MSEDRIAADAVEVARLANLPPIEYGRQRKPAAKALGCPVATLDHQVAAARGYGTDTVGADVADRGRPLAFADVALWPNSVDGAALLDELAAAIRQYVVLTDRQAEAIALWAVFTHAFDAFDFSPRLVLRSVEKRSGKTRVLEVLDRIVRKPLFVSGISAAALLRVIEQHAPAMLLDEIDTLMKGDAEMREALRGLINSGFTRAGARFVKNVPTPDGGYEPRAFLTWCPMLLAGIGKLPDTVADRSIPIEMKRKRPDEKVKPLRAGGGLELRDLGRKALRWAADNLDALRDARPCIPAQLHDRAADAWSPFLAIAELAGGGWTERARSAAVELSADSEDEASNGTTLLADLKAMFGPVFADPEGDPLIIGRQAREVMFTDEILAELAKRDDRPWAELKGGKPITGRQLAGLLKPFGIPTNKTVRRGGRTDKGYKRDWFEETFA